MAGKSPAMTANYIRSIADRQSRRRAASRGNRKAAHSFRETLVLRDIEGLDYRETAEASEVPIGTVMSRLAHARGRLLETLRQDD